MHIGVYFKLINDSLSMNLKKKICNIDVFLIFFSCFYNA